MLLINNLFLFKVTEQNKGEDGGGRVTSFFVCSGSVGLDQFPLKISNFAGSLEVLKTIAEYEYRSGLKG